MFVELQKSLSKLPPYFRPEEIPSVTLRFPLFEKNIEDKDKDSQMETKIEAITNQLSDLQNIKNDINHLTSLMQTLLKRSKMNDSDN